MNLLRYWKIALSLIVLALGCGTIGAAIALRVQNHRLARAAAGTIAIDMSLDRLTETLALTADQRTQVRPLVEQGYSDIRTIAVSATKDVTQVGRRLEQQIRPLLNAEQQQRLQQMIDRRKRLRERWQLGERLTPEQRDWLRERIEQRYGSGAKAEAKPQ